jgi:hypothetical protein
LHPDINIETYIVTGLAILELGFLSYMRQSWCKNIAKTTKGTEAKAFIISHSVTYVQKVYCVLEVEEAVSVVSFISSSPGYIVNVY